MSKSLESNAADSSPTLKTSFMQSRVWLTRVQAAVKSSEYEYSVSRPLA